MEHLVKVFIAVMALMALHPTCQNCQKWFFRRRRRVFTSPTASTELWQ
jgi:hypothetical protein